MIKRIKSLRDFGSLDRERRRIRFDFILFFLVLAISSWGVLIIYSATKETMPGGVSDPQYFMKRRLIWLGVGIVIFIAVQFINYRKIQRYWWLIIAAGILSLVAVLLFGYEVHGSKGWIDLKFTTIQPSEFSKIFMVVVLSAIMSKWRSEKVSGVSFRKGAISSFVALTFVMLFLLEPDYGTAIIYFIVYIGLLFVSGANFLYLLSILGLTAGGFFLALNASLIKQYQLDRILIFLKPDISSIEGAGYNLYQSKLAIGSGGLLGKGLFLGTQTNLNYVPEQHTDFIFSVIGEEMGFVGAVLVILILGVIVWSCFH